MPTLRSHTHLQAAQANAQTKAYKRVCLPNRTDATTLDGRATTEKEGRTHNSTYKKLAVQWLNDPDSYRDCASYQVLWWQTV